LVELFPTLLNSLLFVSIGYYFSEQIPEFQRFYLFLFVFTSGMLCTQGLGYLVGILFVKYEQLGLVCGVLIYTTLSMFCNFYIAIKDMPKFFQWFSLISYPNFVYDSNLIIIYGLDRCSADEFSLILHKYELKNSQLWLNAGYLVLYFISLRIMAYFVLYIKVNKIFEKSKASKAQNIDFESKFIQKDIEKVPKIRKNSSKSHSQITIEVKNRLVVDKNRAQNNKLCIAWINLTLKQEKNLFSDEKIILRKLNGCFEFGTLNALMGSSGAGKTSLLKCINGRNSNNLQISEDSKIFLSKFEKISTCFVCQDVREHLLIGLTAKQSLIYASKLKNSDHKKVDHKSNAENLMIDFLITDIKDTNVENCSGGEQKRLVVAMELTSHIKPNLICIDEPTSGLDSNAAEVVSYKYLI